jgi:phosphoadenosine phosphosulfate reductase
VHPRPRHSQSLLYWCDRCNVPLIGRTCGRCGHDGVSIELSPPGDVRIALEGSKRRLRYLFLRQFGAQQLIPEIVVLNKSSGEDRADEIIVDGRKIALLTYDLEKKDYALNLRIDGARMLARIHPKKLITLKKAEGHMKGNFLPPASIESFDPGIRKDDDVVIQMGKFIGCGSAKVDASQLRSSQKGVKVRDFSQAGPLPPGRKAWQRDVLKANLPHIAAKRAKAEHELKEVFAKNDLPITVSFSGGKDSLVVLDIVSSITKDFTTIFIDTGLEHPRTRDYVKRIAHDRNLRLITASAGDAFDESFPAFGPPAKDFRWCCKVCKLAPASEVIEEKFPKGTLTVEGNRRLESFSRAHTELVEENPFVPGQTILNPIRDWTALDVWLYIMMRDLDYNPLYDEDIERVGCWMCPSSLASECAEISRMSPELARAWDARLASWAEENGLPREFVTHGFWRWKELPPKMKTLAERIGLQVKSKRADTIELKLLKGVSPCAAGGYSVEAVLRMPESKGLKQVAELLKTVGDVRYVEEFGVAIVNTAKGNAKAFAGGQMTAVGETPKDATELFDKVARAVLRANMCTRCGICVRACPSHAISLDLSGPMLVDPSRCTRCGKCAESCVVAHYFDKLAGELPRESTKNRKM